MKERRHGKYRTTFIARSGVPKKIVKDTVTNAGNAPLKFLG